MDTDELTIDALERWALFGAHWRVIDMSDTRVLVELRTCTDEPVERHEVTDAGVITYLRARPVVPH
jgi:hypothetical protein